MTVRKISLLLSAVVIMGTICSNSFSKVNASEVYDENVAIEDICGTDYESVEIVDFDLSSVMINYIENLENMTDSEFNDVFENDEYIKSFEEHYCVVDNKRDLKGQGEAIKKVKELYKRQGRKGIEKLVDKLFAKLPRIIIQSIGKEKIDSQMIPPVVLKQFKAYVVELLIKIATSANNVNDAINIIMSSTNLSRVQAAVFLETINSIM